jgi:basic membrane lipoprotein Med (substrate-binding protein (PBP1-ABC) superfamily)
MVSKQQHFYDRTFAKKVATDAMCKQGALAIVPLSDFQPNIKIQRAALKRLEYCI